MLKIDEEREDVYMQNQLFKTEDNTLQKPKNTNKINNKINEVLSMGSDHTRKSFDIQKLKPSFPQNMNNLNSGKISKHINQKNDFSNKVKSSKKNQPKRASELIYLKK